MDIENDLSHNLENLYPKRTYTNNLLFTTFNINPLFYIYRNTEINRIEDEDEDDDEDEDEDINDDCSNYDEDSVSYISIQSSHTIREYNTVNFVFRKWKIFTMGSFVAITASYVAALRNFFFIFYRLIHICSNNCFSGYTFSNSCQNTL